MDAFIGISGTVLVIILLGIVVSLICSMAEYIWPRIGLGYSLMRFYKVIRGELAVTVILFGAASWILHQLIFH